MRARLTVLVALLLSLLVSAPAAQAEPAAEPPWLTNVSCATTALCVAFADSGYLVRYHGMWSSADHGVSGTAATNDISCASPDFCLGVGSYVVGAYDRTADMWTDYGRSGDDGVENLRSVSCVSEQFCVGVGDKNGILWQNDTPHAINGLRFGNGVKRLVGMDVSCGSPKSCLAVGDNGLVYRYVDGYWKRLSLRADGGAIAISCATWNFCMALSESGKRYRWDHTRWYATPLENDGPGWPTMIDCTSPQRCMALGNEPANGQTYSIRWTGKRWDRTFFFGPENTDVPVTGLSCYDVLTCLAVDSGGRAWKWNGSAWLAPQQIT